jgi:hypothetical protein
MRDFYEMQVVMQMFGGGGMSGAGGGQIWLMIAFLAGLFAVLFWRPATLRHPALFRWSCTLFALAILVPPVFNVGIAMFMGDGMMRGGGGGGGGAIQLLQLASNAGPILFGLSVIFGFAAIAPAPARQVVPAAQEKGPFD